MIDRTAPAPMAGPGPPPGPRGDARRRRVGRVIALVLEVGLVALATFTALVVWHLIRRGRLIREGLPAPKPDTGDLDSQP